MRKLIFFLSLVILPFFMFSQSREELRIKQKQFESRIRYLNNLKINSGKTVEQLLRKIELIDRQIVQQDSLINNLKVQNSKTIEQIESYISERNRLQERFDALKEEYARVLMSYAKTRNAYSDWMYIMAADNLFMVYKRFVYLNQYSDYRKKQGKEIIKTKNRLQLVIDSINQEKLMQEKLILSEQAQLDTLNNLKRERLTLIEDLKKKQAEIQKKLVEINRNAKLVNKQVLSYILDDRKKRKTKAEVINLASGNNKTALANKMIESVKGKLDWPVDRGVIVRRFGIYHPINQPNITMQNYGIDIQTKLGADVKAVFQGKVIKVVAITGVHKSVLIQHGNYYFLYSNLRYVNVKPGNFVKKGQKLGKVYGISSEENTAILKFQMWKASKKLNPEKWLRKGKI